MCVGGLHGSAVYAIASVFCACSQSPVLVFINSLKPTNNNNLP